MSSGAAPSRSLSQQVVRALVLVAAGSLLFWVTRAVPEANGGLWTITAVGFLLLAGTLASELLAPLSLPHLTGYLLAGIAAGPYVLKLVDDNTVKRLSPINTLALALIALAGGAELDMAVLRRGARSLAWAMLTQCGLVLALETCVFLAARPFIPFARDLPIGALIGVALLWGALAVTRSPAATLGILSQTRAQGPLARFTLGFVMASDLVVVVLIATVLGCVRPLVDPSVSFTLHSFATLGQELIGSVAVGTTLGLFIAAYLKLVDRQMLVVLLVLGFGVSTVLDYVHCDALLTFMVAGFTVRNMSAQGHKLVQYIEKTGTVVYVVFFATAGADLDIPLLGLLWPVALLMAGSRGVVTFGASRLAGRLANDPPELRRWSWSGLVSQAGLALGLAVLVSKEFPSIGTPFRALAIATVAVNEMVGPVLFKLALDRSGETSREPSPSFAFRQTAPDVRLTPPCGSPARQLGQPRVRLPRDGWRAARVASRAGAPRAPCRDTWIATLRGNHANSDRSRPGTGSAFEVRTGGCTEGPRRARTMEHPSLPSFLLRTSVATFALALAAAACGSSGSGGAASGTGDDAGGAAQHDSGPGSGSDGSSADGAPGPGDGAADSRVADGASESGNDGGGSAPVPACVSGDRAEWSGAIPNTAIAVAVCSVCGGSYVVASNGGSGAGSVSVANGSKTITVDVAAGAKATSANLADNPADGTVTVCAETPSHACLAKNPQNQRYCNPYRGLTSLVPERIDQGVDYGGAGPIYAMGPGTIDVFKNRNDTGWPGGTFMSYKLTAGPAAGKEIYLAENIDLDTSLKSGSFVYSGTALGTLVDASPDSESGWGVAGSGATAEYGCYTEGCMTPLGVNFNTLLVCLQAPSGTQGTGGCCPQPSGWPSDWCTELAAWQ